MYHNNKTPPNLEGKGPRATVPQKPQKPQSPVAPTPEPQKPLSIPELLSPENIKKIDPDKIDTATKVAMMRYMFANDIEVFGRYCFPNHLSKESPDFHREIFKLYESDATRIAVGAPRGHAKSTITDLVYACWAIVHKKAHLIVLVSDTYSQAVMFLDSLKAEFEENDRLKGLYGDMQGKQWAEDEIVANGCMVKAVGAGMKVRGIKYLQYRPDLIIVDDLENDELVESKDRREKLERWFNGALVPSMAKDGRLVIIGTILHYDSLLSKMLHEEKYREYKKKTYKAINDWGALWPEHLNLEELEKIKKDYMEKGQGYLFYQEYQNDPVSDENRKFKLEKFRYYTEPEVLGKNINTFITIDRAYSKDKTADSTGIVVVSVDQENNWYVRLAERFKGTELELITKIFDLKNYYRPLSIGIEQKAFEYTIKPALETEMRKRNMFFVVEQLKDLGRSKNIRIEGLIPRFEMQTVYLKNDQSDLIDELLKFPKAQHDDLIDALSYQLEMAKPTGRGVMARQFYPEHRRRL